MPSRKVILTSNTYYLSQEFYVRPTYGKPHLRMEIKERYRDCLLGLAVGWHACALR